MPDIRPEDGPERSIYIGIDNEDPIDAGELGRLFSALSTDYRRMTGGRLVVGKLEVGTTHIWIQDAVDVINQVGGTATVMATTVIVVADATERLHKFWKYLRGVVKDEIKDDPAYEALPPVSEEKLIELSDKHGANIRMEERFDGKKLVERKIEITRDQASFQRADIKKRKKERKVKREGSYVYDDIAGLLEADVNSVESVVAALVGSSTRAGHLDAMEQLANDVERYGRPDIAEAIRKHLPPPRRLLPMA
jgi:hypothetical protein